MSDSTPRVFETEHVRVLAVADEKLLLHDTGNTDAWLASEEPITVRDYR